MAALRTTLGAIDNAEAVDVDELTARGGSIARSRTGVGAGESPRRQLSEASVADVVRTEVADRESAAVEYDRLGRSDEARRLRREAEIIAAQLYRGGHP